MLRKNVMLAQSRTSAVSTQPGVSIVAATGPLTAVANARRATPSNASVSRVSGALMETMASAIMHEPREEAWRDLARSDVGIVEERHTYEAVLTPVAGATPEAPPPTCGPDSPG
jgi:prophage DNA circulation protein